MSPEPPVFLAQAIKDAPATPPQGALEALRHKAAEVRADKQEAADLQERLDAVNKRIVEAESKTLPDMMDQLGLSRLDLEPDGNAPGMTFQCGPFYRASIAASWDPEKRQKAFVYLDGEGAGDLVKVTVTLAFGRSDREQADRVIGDLRKAGFSPEVKLDVPHATLTAWVKEQVEKFSKMPKLDLIGGTVGRVVRIKPLAATDNTRAKRAPKKQTKDD
jgi:hypothetical protein